MLYAHPVRSLYVAYSMSYLPYVRKVLFLREIRRSLGEVFRDLVPTRSTKSLQYTGYPPTSKEIVDRHQTDYEQSGPTTSQFSRQGHQYSRYYQLNGDLVEHSVEGRGRGCYQGGRKEWNSTVL